MKNWFGLLLFLFASVCQAAEVIKTVDADDMMPVQGATVFSKSGVILGITDRNGEIKIDNEQYFPILISSIGYSQVTVSDNQQKVIKLVPAVYELAEVVVNAEEHPVKHVMCYIREYLSGTPNNDTLIFYNEHMADFFLTNGKVKGFKSRNTPRILASNLYAKICKQEVGDSVFKPQRRDEMFTWDNLASLPDIVLAPGKVLTEGKTHAELPGKYSTKEIAHLSPTTFTYQLDILADHKDHTMSPAIFKLIGCTIDFTELLNTYVFERNDDNIYNIEDLISATVNMKVVGRGKWLKKIFNSDNSVNLYASYEIYPVSTEYLTVEEAKECLKDSPAINMQRSPNCQPIPEEIQEIVNMLDKR